MLMPRKLVGLCTSQRYVNTVCDTYRHSCNTILHSIAHAKTPVIHYNSSITYLQLSLGYLAGRMRSAFIHHQDFVSVSFFCANLVKRGRCL